MIVLLAADDAGGIAICSLPELVSTIYVGKHPTDGSKRIEE